MHPKSARETVGKHKSRETPPEGAGGTGGKQNKAIKLPEGAGGSVGNHKRKGTQGTGDNTKKSPGRREDVRDSEVRRRPTLPTGVSVPSARAGLTALFGMGRGGTPRLKPPRISLERSQPEIQLSPHMKDFGPLVRVGSRPRSPCTSRLSTS